MGEFAVEAHGAAEVDLLGHDKIAGNRELAWRKRPHLDDGCAWSHSLEAGREPGRISGYLERDLEAAGALDFLFEPAAALADIDRNIRTDLPSQGQRFFEDIGNANGFGPGAASDQQHEQPDWARAGDQHRAPKHRAGPLHRVQRDCQRFGEGRYGEGEARRDWIALALVDQHVVCEAALHVWEAACASHEEHVAAE